MAVVGLSCPIRQQKQRKEFDVDPQILQIIPRHDDETCVQIEDAVFELIAWALIATPDQANRIVPVILFDDQPWPVTVQGEWKVRLCSRIPRKSPKAPVMPPLPPISCNCPKCKLAAVR